MSEAPKPYYEPAKALRFLNEESERANPSRSLRTKAAALLLRSISLLGAPHAGAGDFIIKDEWGNAESLMLSLARQEGSVYISQHDGQVVISRNETNARGDNLLAKVQLVFDRQTGRLESEEIDRDITPVPGHRLPRRDPLVVVLEAALKALAQVRAEMSAAKSPAQ